MSEDFFSKEGEDYQEEEENGSNNCEQRIAMPIFK